MKSKQTFEYILFSQKKTTVLAQESSIKPLLNQAELGQVYQIIQQRHHHYQNFHASQQRQQQDFERSLQQSYSEVVSGADSKLASGSTNSNLPNFPFQEKSR